MDTSLEIYIAASDIPAVNCADSKSRYRVSIILISLVRYHRNIVIALGAIFNSAVCISIISRNIVIHTNGEHKCRFPAHAVKC